MKKVRYRLGAAGVWALLGLAGLGLPRSAPALAPEFDWGFIASRRVDASGQTRFRAAGPFFETTHTPDGATGWALRPLYAHDEDPVSGWSHRYMLWPVGSVHRLKGDLSWRVLLAWGHRFDCHDPRSRYRVWFLPFYFQGRDKQGETYHAVFPFGGRIHEILGMDKTAFVLFPLWSRSSVGDVRNHDILWPIWSRSRGGNIERFRVFPFYGRTEKKHAFKKRFILWPFWTQARYSYPQSSGFGYVFFPFYGRIRLTDQRSWMVLPPFFRYSTSQRVNKLYAPWPFLQMSWGEEQKFYLWPLFGRWQRSGLDSSFLLWPIFSRERLDRNTQVLRRYWALPFFYYETLRNRYERDPQRQVAARAFRFWPVMSYARTGSDRRLRVLDLWPLRRTTGVHRLWTPFWTLFEYHRVEDRSDTECLWGFFRAERRGDAYRRVSLFPLLEWSRDRREPEERRSWSLLKGLVETRREGDTRAWRVLYFIRWGGSKE